MVTKEAKEIKGRRREVKRPPKISDTRIEEILGDLTSQLGVNSVLALDSDGEELYSYFRWEDNADFVRGEIVHNMLDSIQNAVSDMKGGDVDHVIIRSASQNTILHKSSYCTIFVSSSDVANLALLTIRARRASENLSALINQEGS